MPRRAAVDLLAQPSHEDVHGPVAPRLAPPPELLQQLVASHDPIAVERELVQEAELRRRQLAALAVDVRLHLARVDAQLLDLDRLAALGLGSPHAPPRGGVHARDELRHRERLHEVVVGADVERVDAVVLRAARADDDDRRPDALGPRALDHAPAVALRQHQVEDDDVGRLVAERGQALLALRRPPGLVPGGGEVVDHRLGDDLVVFDDQDLGHTGIIAEDAFAELRVGFTAAVSHELRTPLARLLALLDSASLPDADTEALLEQARQEVEAMAELVDDVLFLSELETGRAVVGLGDVPVAPIVRDVVEAMTTRVPSGTGRSSSRWSPRTSSS